MTNEQIIEGNKLIGVFMGGQEVYPATPGWLIYVSGLPNINDIPRDSFEINLGKYHSSWDWLIPVVEKIERLGYDTKICCFTGSKNGSTYIKRIMYIENYLGDEIAGEYGETKIESAFKSVVKFIQWYNQNKEK